MPVQDCGREGGFEKCPLAAGLQRGQSPQKPWTHSTRSLCRTTSPVCRPCSSISIHPDSHRVTLIIEPGRPLLTDTATGGRSRTPYDLGVKVSVSVTVKERPVWACARCPATLRRARGGQPARAGRDPDRRAIEDRAGRSRLPQCAEVGCGTRLLVNHTRRLPRALKRLLKRRRAIETVIGHMKTDGLLNRNWLKGALGDAMHALLFGAGHNLRMILAHLRVHYCALVGQMRWRSCRLPS